MSRYFKAHKRAKEPKALETCPLCKCEAELVQDHCHSTGLNRDRICNRCNNLVARIEWTPPNRQQLEDYIDRWRWEHQHGGTPYRPSAQEQGANNSDGVH